MMQAPSISTPVSSPISAKAPGCGGRLVSPTGHALPLLGATLTADAAGGVARVVVEQRFRNPHAEALAVTYSLPLPADGAVSGFAFRVGARRVVGEIDRRHAARERYEEALLEGRSAALLEQDRSSLFTQEIGNIPPGEELVVEVVIEQRLRWLDEGAWEWRFPTVVAPRYLGEGVPDAARVEQDVAAGPLPARVVIACSIRDALPEGRRPESPSHAIEVLGADLGLRVQLRDAAGARLDRDVVVRWAAATPRVGVTLEAGRPAAGRAIAASTYGLLTVVPPSLDAGVRSVPRDLIVLLDTSGSMSGEPLAQAQRVAAALVETLRAEDQLELIEFSSAPRRWKSAPVAATESARREALAWLRALRASGGTEMRTGILEAMSALRPESQRQVVLVTDGMIGSESQVVAAICARLPASARLHTVGVGSAVNRSLTGPAARAGRGIEVVIGLGEDPERAAARLVARTQAPLVVELALEGSALIDHAPRRLPDLFAGAPALVGVALRPEGGELRVRGRTAEGAWEQTLTVAPLAAGAGSPVAAALFGREAVEDLELGLAAGGEGREIDAAIERLGVDFQIATRLTSWVAIAGDVTVDPRDSLRRERQPQELPYGMSAEGLGLRPAAAAMPASAMPASRSAPPMRARSLAYNPPGGGPATPPQAKGKIDMKARLGSTRPVASSTIEAPSSESKLIAPQGSPAPAAPRFEAPHSGPASFGALEPKEAEKAAPAKKDTGIVGALKRLFRGEAAADAPASPPPPQPAFVGPVAPEPRRLRGRIALRRGSQLVIEVLAEGAPLAWDPGLVATVELASGGVIEVAVARDRSTRAGTVAAGASGRLALEVPEAIDREAIRRIVIVLGGERVTIEL